MLYGFKIWSDELVIHAKDDEIHDGSRLSRRHQSLDSKLYQERLFFTKFCKLGIIFHIIKDMNMGLIGS